MHLSIFDRGEFLEEKVSDFEDGRLYFAAKIAGFDFDSEVKTRPIIRPCQECVYQVMQYVQFFFVMLTEMIFQASNYQSIYIFSTRLNRTAL